MIVKKYMMRTLTSVDEEDSIQTVIECMHKSEMSVLPVVNEENKFLGTIYGNTILRNIIPEQYGFIDSRQLLYEINQAAENLSEIKDKPVKNYMLKSVSVVKEDEKMNNIADIMLSNQESILFVVNKHGNLRGYISRADLLYYLLEVTDNKEQGE